MLALMFFGNGVLSDAFLALAREVTGLDVNTLS